MVCCFWYKGVVVLSSAVCREKWNGCVWSAHCIGCSFCYRMGYGYDVYQLPHSWHAIDGCYYCIYLYRRAQEVMCDLSVWFYQALLSSWFYCVWWSACMFYYGGDCGVNEWQFITHGRRSCLDVSCPRYSSRCVCGYRILSVGYMLCIVCYMWYSEALASEFLEDLEEIYWVMNK